jgi:hypothetical protein
LRSIYLGKALHLAGQQTFEQALNNFFSANATWALFYLVAQIMNPGTCVGRVFVHGMISYQKALVQR